MVSQITFILLGKINSITVDSNVFIDEEVWSQFVETKSLETQKPVLAWEVSVSLKQNV